MVRSWWRGLGLPEIPLPSKFPPGTFPAGGFAGPGRLDPPLGSGGDSRILSDDCLGEVPTLTERVLPVDQPRGQTPGAANLLVIGAGPQGLRADAAHTKGEYLSRTLPLQPRAPTVGTLPHSFGPRDVILVCGLDRPLVV